MSARLHLAIIVSKGGRAIFAHVVAGSNGCKKSRVSGVKHDGRSITHWIKPEMFPPSLDRHPRPIENGSLQICSVRYIQAPIILGP